MMVSHDGKPAVIAVSDREMSPDPECRVSCFRGRSDGLHAALLPKPTPAGRTPFRERP